MTAKKRPGGETGAVTRVAVNLKNTTQGSAETELARQIARANQLGYRTHTCRIYWDTSSGRKSIANPPPKNWQLEPQETPEAVAKRIKNLCNAYLIHGPASGVTLHDGDTPEETARIRAALGVEPHVTSGQGRSHTYSKGVVHNPELKTMKTAFGPGSYFDKPDGRCRYTGELPAIDTLPTAPSGGNPDRFDTPATLARDTSEVCAELARMLAVQDWDHLALVKGAAHLVGKLGAQQAQETWDKLFADAGITQDADDKAIIRTAVEKYGAESTDGDGRLTLAELHEGKIVAELNQLRVRDEARRRLTAEQRPPAVFPEILNLRTRLARPRPEQRWRVDGYQPLNSRVITAAQFKAGKTTLNGNLARSLVDGDPFLGEHTVTSLNGSFCVLDFEMSEHQLDDWLREQNIRNDHKVVPVPLRGNAAAFDIIDPECRSKWATLLKDREVEYLSVDCLRPILDSLGLDEHRDAGKFLVAFDALLAEAGITDALLIHHMGHNGERSRGDSRIRDWPDVEWRLVREDDDPASARYLTAFGRDVDMPERALAYNTLNRHLTLTGAGGRKDAAARLALEDVLAVLDTADEPLSGRQLEAAVSDISEHSQKTIRAATKLGVKDRVITVEDGPKRSKLHSSASVRSSASPVRQRTTGECVSASIGNAHAHTSTQDSVRQAKPPIDTACIECGDTRPLNPNTKTCAPCYEETP